MKISGVFFLFSVSLLEATLIKVLPYEKVLIYQRQDPSLVLLQQSALQTGSQQDGQNGTPEAGQVPSLTYSTIHYPSIPAQV
jgi:hypothetical protein